MGACASTHQTTQGRQINNKGGATTGGTIRWAYTVKVIHVDGRLEEFKQAIKADQVLSKNPKCFLCSLESMYMDSYVQKIDENEELQLGQIYFIMPTSVSLKPLSLSDLCALAIKASSALEQYNQMDLVMSKNGSNLRTSTL